MVLFRKGEEEHRHDVAGDSGVSEARQGGSEGPRRGCFRTARCTLQQQPKQMQTTASENTISNDSSEPDGQHDKQSECRFAKRAWNTLPCVTCASPCPTRQRIRSTGSLQGQSLPGEKPVLVDNGLKGSCSMPRVLIRTWFVRVTGSLCEEVSNCR